MRTEVAEFFNNKGYPLSALAARNRKRTSRGQIAKACEVVYDEIKNGLAVKDINLPRRVYATSERVKGEEWVGSTKTVNKLNSTISSLKRDISFHFYTKIGILLLAALLGLSEVFIWIL